MPEDKQVNDVWASNALTEHVTLPSGQTVVAQRIGTEEILSSGSSDQMDTLTSYVLKNHVESARGPQDRKPKKSDQDAPVSEEDVEKIIAENPEMVNSTLSLFDSLIPSIVVKPMVRLHTRKDEGGNTEAIPVSDREPGIIYTDRIGLEDKVYLFQWAVGGLPDPRFREQRGKSVAAVEDGEHVQVPSVGTVGTTNKPPRKRNRKR